MTMRPGNGLVTIANFEGLWDALWSGWYTDQSRNEFRIKIERLGQGPHVTVELSERDISALREKFGPDFDPDEKAVVILGGVLEIEGRVREDGWQYFDLVVTREDRSSAIRLLAIGESVRLSIRDTDWAACRERLGIGQPLGGESEEVA